MLKTELEKLKKETEEYEIMVCRGYNSNGGADIGIRRRTIHDESMADPIVDGWPVMICGDIYDHSHLSSGFTRATYIEDLYKELLIDKSKFCVCLRADAYQETYLLGLYEIEDILEVYTSNYAGYTEAIKLRVKKI